MAKNTHVLDEAANDKSVAPVRYDITSFGADYDVEGLVNRLRRNDVYVPTFQRDYVWSIAEASRFVESLLLGLPVPGIFLARQSDSSRLLVIDGQQRLKSLLFFFDGYFDPRKEYSTQRVFRLTGVQDRFRGLTYDTLPEDARRTLHDSILHATIIKQDSPADNDTSIYHIFERLNTSGRKLTPQQIRVAIYQGGFVALIRELNEYPGWREIFGKHSVALKDQELVLRFLALYFFAHEYERPMNEFLNKFTIWARRQPEDTWHTCSTVFKSTIDIVINSIGPKAFRRERALNAAVYDSVMIGIARRLLTSQITDLAELQGRYQTLLNDETFVRAISQSTSDEKNVEFRLDYVTAEFADVA